MNELNCFDGCDNTRCSNYGQDTIPFPLCEKQTEENKEKYRVGLILCALEGKELVKAPTLTRNISPHYEFLIGIGKDHSMKITIDAEAYKELIK